MASKRSKAQRTKEPIGESPAPPAPPASSAPEPWKKPNGLTPRGLAVLAGLILLMNVPVLHRFLRGPPQTTVGVPFEDDFSGSAPLENRYFSNGGDWRIRDGVLLSPGVHNNALWLKASLPENVRVTVDVRALVPEADERVEVFGNGSDALSGYRLVLTPLGAGVRGVLYRLAENGPTWSDLKARSGTSGPMQAGLYARDTAVRVEGRVLTVRSTDPQRWVIERRNGELRWTVNGQLVLEFVDPIPLTGRVNDRLALSSGEFDVAYSRLQISPSGGEPFAALVAPVTPLPAGPFSDRFDRTELGPDWRPTDPAAVHLEGGAVVIERAHNHPLWLVRRLPLNATIEIDAWSESPDGDLKVELWGDGTSAHEGNLAAAYRASGYVLVMGGWRNTRSAIARQEEHGRNTMDRLDVRVEPGRHYHWRIIRQGTRLSWEVDGAPFLSLDDSTPLSGAGHEYFAFSGWEARVHFDNLRITPLP